MPAQLDWQQERQALQEIRDELSDLSPLLERVRDEAIIAQVETLFDTDGLGQWDPTTRPNPILRDTYDLYTSVTDPNSGVYQITAYDLDIDHTIFYGDLHEGGWDEFNVPYPPRPIFGLVDVDADVARIGQEWADELDAKLSAAGL